MMRALDSQSKVGSPDAAVDFPGEISAWWDEIVKPDHELVDEAASRAAEAFVAAAGQMAGVNADPATGATLGSVWDITSEDEMSN
jgi:hypothetical protein